MAYYKSLDATPAKPGDTKDLCVPIFTEYELAELVFHINENFQDDIEDQNCIKSIIDYQFE